MNKKEKALDVFSGNFNCSQAVLSPFAEELGIEKEIYLKVATAFGGGMRKGEVCGAVTGALMGLGLNYGHYENDNLVSKDKAYALTKEFMKSFEEKNGSVICKNLLGYDLSNEEELKIIKEKGLFKSVCPKAIESAVEILEEILKREKDENNN